MRIELSDAVQFADKNFVHRTISRRNLPGHLTSSVYLFYCHIFLYSLFAADEGTNPETASRTAIEDI